jgi:hypothetical protein
MISWIFECFVFLLSVDVGNYFCNIDIHFLCLDQEEGEEAEAVIQQMLQGGVLVAGAREGVIIRIPQTIPGALEEVMVIFSAVHDRKMS